MLSLVSVPTIRVSEMVSFSCPIITTPIEYSMVLPPSSNSPYSSPVNYFTTGPPKYELPKDQYIIKANSIGILIPVLSGAFHITTQLLRPWLLLALVLQHLFAGFEILAQHTRALTMDNEEGLAQPPLQIEWTWLQILSTGSLLALLYSIRYDVILQRALFGKRTRVQEGIYATMNGMLSFYVRTHVFSHRAAFLICCNLIDNINQFPSFLISIHVSLTVYHCTYLYLISICILLAVTKHILLRCPTLTTPYVGTPWLWNGDLRTGIPFLIFKSHPQSYHRRWVDVEGGECVALDIAFPPSGHDPTKAVVLVLHGLNGGSQEPYVIDLVEQCMKNGYTVAVMVARGLMNTPLVNRVVCIRIISIC